MEIMKFIWLILLFPPRAPKNQRKIKNKKKRLGLLTDLGGDNIHGSANVHPP